MANADITTATEQPTFSPRCQLTFPYNDPMKLSPVILILWMRKPRFREVRLASQAHSWDVNAGPSLPIAPLDLVWSG